MFRTIQDFIELWKSEADSTIKIFSNITDDKLDNKVSENIRSLGRLAWHITQTLTEMPYKAGIVDKDDLDELPVPSSVKDIVDIYKKYSEALIKSLEKKWTDKDLAEVIDMYGQKWEKRKILQVLITHQIHHRAQMTVIMRLQNIPVPGIYGPSKEEWTQFGMTPQD
ncbi:MAG: DinB family protein [Calditrichaceae bacterium]